MAAAVLAAGVFGVPAIAERNDSDGPAAELVPDADAQPDAVSAGDVEPVPWLEPTENSVPAPVDDTLDPDEARRRQLARCEVEHGTMTSIALAFVTQTRSVPDNLDEVESTWLREAPDGWNNEWTFQIVGDGMTIVPTPGGACDL